MKFFELENKEPSRPVVYVDMDGVLADFFGEIAQHHGVKNWRDARKVRKSKDRSIDKIAQKPGYFLHLKPLPHASELIRGVLKIAGAYSILSSPLLSNVEQSSREKAEWLDHHLSRHSPQSIIFDHEKFKFARQADGTANILIDDNKTNIYLWNANGGIGILYRDSDCSQVLKKLQAALAGRYRPSNDNRDQDHELHERQEHDVDFNRELYTNKEVLQYTKGIHAAGYSLDEPILKYKTWRLTMIPVRKLSNSEKYDQDDPFNRVIDIDLDHVRDITREDVLSRPLVLYPKHGILWVLDGNHRATAARALKMKHVPAFVPVID